MFKKLSKVVSLFVALMMTLSVFTPAVYANEKQETKTWFDWSDDEDTQKPTVKFKPNASNSDQKIVVEAVLIDKDSGVNKWRYALSEDGGQKFGKWTKWNPSQTIKFQEPGNWVIKAEIRDKAGNKKTLTSGVYKIENETITPQKPTLTIVAKKAGIQLKWDALQNVKNYEVMRSDDGENFKRIFKSSNESKYIDAVDSVVATYTYKVVVTFTNNETKESNEITCMVSEQGVVILDGFYTDQDKDGLTDYEESELGTDPQNKDTDEDGIMDGDEVYVLFTNPLKADTDKNGVTDAEEDFDQDGLNNKSEIDQYKTNPLSKDTDNDKLTDKQEIKKYKTDPLSPDTDGDRFKDGNEIKYGTDPLKKDTDGDGILDGAEKFDVDVRVDAFEKDATVEPSVRINLKGEEADSVTISNLSAAKSILSNQIAGYVGAPFEFNTTADFDTAEITFKFDKKLLKDTDFEPVIYRLNEEDNILDQVSVQNVNVTDGTVTATVNHFSTYILLNKTKFDEFWERDMKDPFDGEIENVELVVGFAIDSSGSMTSNDPSGLRKETSKAFVDKFDDNDKAAVIDFDDSATVLASLTSDKTVIKNAIDQIDSSGGTDLGVGLQAVINEIKDSETKAKYAILLTDGEGSYSQSVTQAAIDNGITVITIGLGSGVNESLLTDIAEDTGGNYYFAEKDTDLGDVFDQTTEETIDLTTDTDNDGLSDYHEKKGFRSNTTWIYTDYQNPDTDGDGILDGDEVQFKKRINPSGVEESYFDTKSDPTQKDSDGDGLNDPEDPYPFIFDVSDRILALTAGLSYTNLRSELGKTVGEILDNGFKIQEDAVAKENLDILRSAKIIYANDSETRNFFGGIKDTSNDIGLGAVALKFSTPNRRDAIVYAFRGTEVSVIAPSDLFVDAGAYFNVNPQANFGFQIYEELTDQYLGAKFYLTGHSLGGRTVQDVLYKIYKKNTSGKTAVRLKVPDQAATFNALGYSVNTFNNFPSAFRAEAFGLLNNYAMQDDLVGVWFGNSPQSARVGSNIPPFIALDENGAVIPFANIFKLNKFNYDIVAFHGIKLFTYPFVQYKR